MPIYVANKTSLLHVMEPRETHPKFQSESDADNFIRKVVRRYEAQNTSSSPSKGVRGVVIDHVDSPASKAATIWAFLEGKVISYGPKRPKELNE